MAPPTPSRRGRGLPSQCKHHWFRAGANEIAITTRSGSWALYDWVGFEAPAGLALEAVTGAVLSSIQAQPVLVERGGRMMQVIRIGLRNSGGTEAATIRAGAEGFGSTSRLDWAMSTGHVAQLGSCELRRPPFVLLIMTSTASAKFVDTVRARVAQVVVGQDTVVERLLVALFTGGHLLLQGMPGLAKTLLVNCIARAVDLRFSRVQFTIDLLPSDIIGSEILDQRAGEFRTHKGPIFTNLLLADEINRAAPKVQSALLEAMQERKVTIGNTRYPLPAPFVVIATQNPIEQSGTFELPEAQLDRFLLCHRLHYPSAAEEENILERSLALGLKREQVGAVPKTAFDLLEQPPVATVEDLTAAMEAVQAVYVSAVFRKHCVELVRRTRHTKAVELGGSPRAGIALTHASRARALIHGRDYVVPEDLYALAEDVLLHRMRLTYEALAEGVNGATVLKQIVAEMG